MKKVLALVALICLLGVAAAQTMFTGEGYSSSQLAFYNSPTTSTFEPNVEKYWGSYIAGAQNTTADSTMSDIAIWMNTFPLNFNTPVKVASSSFATNVAVPTLSASEMNSQFLTRNVNSKFSINEVQSNMPAEGSLSASNGTEIPTKDAEGQVISQGIISLFNV
jgi:hypothetical protein